MKIISLDQVPKMKLDMQGTKGVHKQVSISRDDGTPSFCFRVFTVEPGGHTPFHFHPFEHLNYIIEGKGALVDENNQEYPVKTGVAASETLKAFGEFKPDSLNLSELGKNNAEAVRIMDRAGWR